MVVEQTDEGQRIDVFLADKVPQHSRSYIQKLLKDGLVLADNEKVKQNYRVRAGNIIDMNIPPPKDIFEPQAMALDIIYEDEDIVVVNKLCTSVSDCLRHPANALLYAWKSCRDWRAIRPGIVHRLIRIPGPAGSCKNDRAHRHLSAN